MKIQSWSIGFTLLLLTLFPSIGTCALAAHAQSASRAPVIDEFYVESDDQLAAGSQLQFTIEGSAKANASVRISGISQRIPLKEVDAGVYEGGYTVKAGDRITSATTARATLKRGNRSSSAVLQESLGLTSALESAVPALASNMLVIENFSATPIDKIEPGADLEFAMVGSPGGQASVNIEGLSSSVPLREVKSGTYRGSYTIRRADKISSTARATGVLVVGGKTLRTNLNQSLTAAAKRGLIRNLSPRDGETVAASALTSVSGSFDDSGVDVDPNSVKLVIAGRDVTRSTEINRNLFIYRGELQPGAYTAVVTARDLSGNTASQTWNFKVAGTATAVTTLPLEIVSHQNNAVIAPGLTEIRGRTAPNATVDIQTTVVSTVFGAFGVSEKLPPQSVRADANGNFAFSFQPQSMGKGARYDVAMTASKNGLTQVVNLSLLQKQ